MGKGKKKAVIVTGPTATGKTSLAVQVANHFSGEIISADSRQVFKGMDIGTGKDLEEYRISDTKTIKTHLIDVVTPNDSYHLKRFCDEANWAINDIQSRGILPFIVGGTPLYIDALLRGYELKGEGDGDKEQRDTLMGYSIDKLNELLRKEFPDLYDEVKDHNNRIRLVRALEKGRSGNKKVELKQTDTEFLVIGVYRHRKKVHERIKERLLARLDAGMVDEVRHLHDSGVSWERLEFFGLEYRFIAEYLQGKLEYDEMVEKLYFAIRKFAKRQDIWFRKIERNGFDIHWIDVEKFDSNDEACLVCTTLIDDFLRDVPLPKPEIRMDDIRYGR